ncbi:MAG: hypothetical protein IJL42_08945 [Bacteroidales bacterium]|jgi:hypothetical protein|nr:hypothetical protein [Bacteroidales bacterium]MBR4228533.1 hypothetical protein [Bacteroidales bacterium]
MRRLYILFTAALVLFLAAGCSTNQGFNVKSCSVASVTPNGLRALKAVLKVGIVNPMSNLTISRIDGVINNAGRELATFKTGKIKVARKSDKVYPLTCEGAISKDVGLMDLLQLASSQDFSQMTVDLKVKVRFMLGICKTFKFNDIKVSDLLEPSVAATYLDLIINETMI